MTPLQAAVLGVVQGLSEFLPISSSGHLILVPFLLGWERHGLAFDAALHLGTVTALIAYFWHDWVELVRAVMAGLRDPAARSAPGWRLAWRLALACLPAGLVGLAFESAIESMVRQPWLVATLLIVFGLLLLVADRLAVLKRGLVEVRFSDALVIGLAQCLALAPGVSRSGITLTAGLLLGLDRPTAARFSFLLSTPITLAAALFSLRKLMGPGVGSGDQLALLIGVVLAAASGWLAIGFLLRYLQRNTLSSFVWYRLAIGGLVLAVTVLGLRTQP